MHKRIVVVSGDGSPEGQVAAEVADGVGAGTGRLRDREDQGCGRLGGV